MIANSRKVRALGLCSGGLDSILSALVLRRQSIEVEWVTFETPFFTSEKAQNASSNTGIPLIVENITSLYLEMLKNPPCGYGQHMNPCLDCHALMFRLAGEIMKKREFDFMFSGEVAGQRPMSQTKPSLRYVEKHSGFDGYIVRPLSGKILPETIPEKEGKVKRDLLLNFSGRSRKQQIVLAKEFGVTNYPAPAGGCLLTDKGYSSRLKDLFDHYDTYTENELQLLKCGRHFRLNKDVKIIVGRTHEDNENIKKYIDPEMDIIIEVKDFPGPTVRMQHGADRASIILAASICAGYSKAPDDTPVDVEVISPHCREFVQVLGIQPTEVKGMLL